MDDSINKPKHRPSSSSGWEEDSAAEDLPHRRGRVATPRGGTRALSQQQVSVAAAFQRIDHIVERLDEHARRDEESLGSINGKLDDHGETLTKLREGTAEMRAEIRGLAGELRHARDLQRISDEAEAAQGVEMVRMKRLAIPWRAKVIIAVIGVIGGAITALLASRG